MYQLSEVLNLIFDSIGLLVIITLRMQGIIPSYRLFYLGFACIWFSNVCTVVEGYVFPATLNFLEHFTFSISGLFFIYGFYVYFLKTDTEQR